eukprot:SAG11_NODE_3959_length_2132_cov_1.651254_1_plen_75_part_00
MCESRSEINHLATTLQLLLRQTAEQSKAVPLPKLRERTNRVVVMRRSCDVEQRQPVGIRSAKRHSSIEQPCQHC